MESTKKRVCVIGTGPAGMSVNVAFKMAKDAGEDVPDVVCYEKQETYGGLWNYTWRTGVDSHGEPIHNTMYHGLMINAPKENYEYPYYTFNDHFGKATPSYPPRLAMRSYIEARFLKHGDPSTIRFNTVVKNVKFDDATQKFTVRVRDFSKPDEESSEFDYVIVSTGHFSYPNAPVIEGYESFTGTIIHSHDQRTFNNYKGKTVMVIGTSFSAEDVASIAYKNGATRLVCCYRTNAMPYQNWPEAFSNHKLPTKIDGRIAHFDNGDVIEIDVIIACTGFNLHYPFMDEKIRLVSKNMIVPDKLYRTVIWPDNNKLMYLGMQQQVYTFTMLDVFAFYLKDVIVGNITLPSSEDQKAWVTKWQERQSKFTGYPDMWNTQGDYIKETMDETSYPLKEKWDVQKTNANFLKWMYDKVENIMEFRNKTFVSAVTGVESLETKVKWFDNHDYTIKNFLSNGQEKPEKEFKQKMESNQTLKVQFVVQKAETEHGENLYLIGNLNDWNIKTAYPLETSKVLYPRWLAQNHIEISNKEQTYDIQYKYIKVDSTGNVIWEDGENRQLDLSALYDRYGGTDLVLQVKDTGFQINKKPQIIAIQPEVSKNKFVVLR